MQQRQEEGDGISEHLAHAPKGLMGIPQQILHGRRIAILPRTGETRKSLWAKQERIIRVHNDFANYATIPRRWWHPLGWEQKRATLAFVDGHCDFVPVQMRVANTGQYRRDPQYR